jgi:hypothetical protein
MSTWNWTQFLNKGQRFRDLKKRVKIETATIKMWKNYSMYVGGPALKSAKVSKLCARWAKHLLCLLGLSSCLISLVVTTSQAQYMYWISNSKPFDPWSSKYEYHLQIWKGMHAMCMFQYACWLINGAKFPTIQCSITLTNKLTKTIIELCGST